MSFIILLVYRSIFHAHHSLATSAHPSALQRGARRAATESADHVDDARVGAQRGRVAVAAAVGARRRPPVDQVAALAIRKKTSHWGSWIEERTESEMACFTRARMGQWLRIRPFAVRAIVDAELIQVQFLCAPACVFALMSLCLSVCLSTHLF